jgi:DAACS family dicarboxylate/amino acid:cation (Na+ or H+) symporter
MKTHIKLLLALVLGIVLGTILHQVNDNSILIWINENILGIVSQVFLKLIFMIVVPMVFCALILGVYELASTDNLKRVARKTIFLPSWHQPFPFSLGWE